MNIKTGLSNRLVSLSASVVVLLLAVFASTVNAQTFNVSTITDFRSALEDAAENNEDDVIILAANTYKTTDDGRGTFRFLDNKAHNLTIQAAAGLTADDVILDGDTTHQVLNYTNTVVSTLALDRISIIKGNAIDSGGGVALSNSNNLIVTGSIISDNRTVGYSSAGGGIYGGGAVMVADSMISGNTAFATNSSKGGGIYSVGAVTVTNSMISVNRASNDSGVSYGGGIYGEGAVTVTNSSISGNAASAPASFAYGGGIYGEGAVTVSNSTISGNTASISNGNYSSYGGGIYGGGAVTATNSTISGNTARAYYTGTYYFSYGGGIYGGGTVTVTNTTISGNTAYASGGGIYGGGAVTATNSTISGNTASFNTAYGGGIYGGGIFVNNIFSDNSSDIYFTRESYVYNNYIDYITKLQNEFGPGIHVYKFENIKPSAGIPNFADISYRLGQGSVAIDAGLYPWSSEFAGLFMDQATGLFDQATLLSVQNALATDKDGNPRIVGGVIDLGAYEYSNNNLLIGVGSILGGNGTVISHPAAIHCGAGNTDCFAYYSSSTMVSLEASPAIGGSIFHGWSGAADCSDGQVIVDQPVTCTAFFYQCTPSSIARTGGSLRGSIGAAYGLVIDGLSNGVIDIIGSNQQEVLSLGVTVTLNGGYDCAFTEPPLLMTTITGSVTVTSGTVTLNNIQIQ